MHLMLQCKQIGQGWISLAGAPVGEGIGGIDTAHRKLAATRDRYSQLGVLDPGAEWRIVRLDDEPQIASGLVTLVALAMVGMALTVYAGIISGLIRGLI